jgi:hypothetical protein
MVARVLAELVAGIGFLVAGVYYFRGARALCDRMRAQAQARAERASPRWRWFFYPRWWYGTGQDLLAARGSAVGMILFGIVFLVVAGLTAFHVHP